MSDEDLPPDVHGERRSRIAAGKRRRPAEEEELGSQQSIMKWMRHVPGPLQDVMKKKADQLEGSMSSQNVVTSANPDGFTVTLVTVFDQGPWVGMCQHLGMTTTPGKTYGGIKMSSLKSTVQNIVEDDQAITKVPQLLVLIKTVRYVDEEIVAVLHDPTGEIEGYFHRELVEHLGPALVAGTGILLYKVSIFTPTEAPASGRRKSYLNITPRNVRRLFVAQDHSSSAPRESVVEQFNKQKEIEAGQESDNDDYDGNMASSSEQAARHLLQHRNVRDTSAELTFLSQRQVVHRNPPVRVDPDAATTATVPKKKGKRGKGAAAKNAQEESGLGRWQWSKLLKKNTDNDGEESSTAQGRQGFLDASSRLVSLISKQNSRSRLSVSSDRAESNRTPSPGSKRSVSFAPGTAFDPPRSPRNSDNRDVTELSASPDESIQKTPSVVVPAKQVVFAADNMSDEDDEDW